MAATWIDDVRTWPAPRPTLDDGLGLLADTLLEVVRDGGSGPYGADRPADGSMRHMSVCRWPTSMLCESLLAPTSWIWWTPRTSSAGLRMVKSDHGRSSKVAHICDVVSGAFEGLP